MKKFIKKIIVNLLIIAATGGVGYGNTKALSKSRETIRVGSKNFTENLIVGEIYALALEDAGYKVERMPGIAGTDIHNAIVNGEIDLYPEYTGTGLISILKLDVITDPQKVYDVVKSEYEKKFNLVWLNYSEANDGQGLVIRTDVAEKLGIKTISDLKEHVSELTFVSQGEFDTREDGIPRLEKVYGKFNWKPILIRVYNNSLKYRMLLQNEADFAPAYTTEAQLINNKFTLLEDDKNAWPPYNLAPIIRKSVLERNPEIADILNEVSDSLDTKKLTKLNAEVDLDRKDYKTVAKEYYESIED